MGVQVQWLYENRILHQQFYGELTTDDIIQMVAASEPLVAGGPQMVHTLVDALHLDKFPTNLATLRHAVAAPRNANLGWVIFVQNKNPLLKFLSAALAQVTISNVRFRIFDSYAAALAFLVDMDSTLDRAVLDVAIPTPPTITNATTPTITSEPTSP